MTQKELNRAVARATGESVHEITQRGFVELEHVPIEREPRDEFVEDLILDWDDHDADRNVAIMPLRELTTA